MRNHSDRGQGIVAIEERERALAEESGFICISLVDPRSFLGDAAPSIDWTFYLGSCSRSTLAFCLPLPFLSHPSPPLCFHSLPNMVALDEPPLSDSEPDVSYEEYKYKSEGELLLANSARTLLECAEGNHRCKLIA